MEDGVEVQFVDPQNAVFRTGDYWLIPARVATGDVKWPRERFPGDADSHPVATLANGVTHHHAPLGVVNFNGKTIAFDNECRLQIPGAVPVPSVKPVKVTRGR